MNTWDLAKTASIAYYGKKWSVKFEDLPEPIQKDWLKVAEVIKAKIEEENNE